MNWWPTIQWWWNGTRGDQTPTGAINAISPCPHGPNQTHEPDPISFLSHCVNVLSVAVLLLLLCDRYGTVDERGYRRFDLEVVERATQRGAGDRGRDQPSASAVSEEDATQFRPLRVGDVVKRGPGWETRHGAPTHIPKPYTNTVICWSLFVVRNTILIFVLIM